MNCSELHTEFIIQLTYQGKEETSYKHEVFSLFIHTYGFKHQICPGTCVSICTIWGIWVPMALSTSSIWGGFWVLVSFTELLMDLSWSIEVARNYQNQISCSQMSDCNWNSRYWRFCLYLITKITFGKPDN